MSFISGNSLAGSRAPVTTAAQPNITSLGTLTALTVDDVAINGKVVTMTGSTSDTAVFTAGTNGTLSIVTTDDAAAAANITITADGTSELAGTTVTLNSSGGVTIDADNGTITFADAGSSLGTITSSGYTGDVVGDVTGNADTATILATARTIGGTSFDGSDNIVVALAATATALASARTIGGVSFDGTANINLPGVNTSGSQDTSGTAALATTVTITDNESTNESNAIIFTAGGDVDGGNLGLESDGTLTYNPSTGKVTATGFVGTLTGAVTGNADTATALATARTIGGTSFDGTANINLPGVNTSGSQDTSGTAAIATTVTITDNESTNESNAIIFTAGGDIDGGNLGLESDGTLTYNPSTGKITATGFVGTLTGDVTGNTSGTAATVTTPAQPNITSLGTLTALTVDDVAIDGKVITMTGSSSDTAIFTASTNGALSIVTTDAAAAAANITITADGTAELAGTTVTLNSSGGVTIDADNGTITFSDAGSSLGTITSSGYTGDVVGNVSGTAATVTTAAQPNITSLGTLTTLTVDNVIINGANIGHTSDPDLMTVADGVLTIAGELDAATLDISGNADIDGTMEADAYTVDGTALNEYISDTVGAMVSSNTETGITVTYQDGDNTLDFVIGTLNQDTSGTAAKVTVTDSTTNLNFPVVFHNESNALLDDTGALRYNPSTGTLLVPNLTVAGTTTQVDTVTMQAAKLIVLNT